jgi:hypothetical protein
VKQVPAPTLLEGGACVRHYMQAVQNNNIFFVADVKHKVCFSRSLL